MKKIFHLLNPFHKCRFDTQWGIYLTRSGAEYLLRCRCGKPMEVNAV